MILSRGRTERMYLQGVELADLREREPGAVGLCGLPPEWDAHHNDHCSDGQGSISPSLLFWHDQNATVRNKTKIGTTYSLKLSKT